MNYYIITDTHFDHPNIMKFCNRPVDHMERIMSNLEARAKSDTTLIHLGDVAWHNESKWHIRLNHLPFCQRYMVRGNHDKRGFDRYIQWGWSAVVSSLSLDIYGEKILFSHKPMPLGGNTINIHGHFHNITDGRWREIEPELCQIVTPDNHVLVMLENETEFKGRYLNQIVKEVWRRRGQGERNI